MMSLQTVPCHITCMGALSCWKRKLFVAEGLVHIAFMRGSRNFDFLPGGGGGGGVKA